MKKSFHNFEIYPTIEDINRSELAELSPNLISSAYNNSEHYFETQFSLLREELVRPLVQSVNKFRELALNYGNKKQNKENIFNKNNKSFKEFIESETDFNVYNEIQVLGIDVNYNCGLVLIVTLDHELLELIDWSVSRLQIYLF